MTTIEVMQRLQRFIDLGGTLKLPFKYAAEEWYCEPGVTLCLIQKYYHTNVGHEYFRFKNFRYAYQFFIKHADPKINPGRATQKSLNMIHDPEQYDDDELTKKMIDMIKKKGWSLKYIRSIPHGCEPTK